MEMPSKNPEKKKSTVRASWLPSKKVGLTLLVLTVLLIITAVLLHVVPILVARQKARKPLPANPAVQAFVDRDTDGDGVADWQEVLVYLDPEKTDTDGDGVDDKAQFEAIRNLAQDPREIDQRLEQASDEDKVALLISDRIGKAILAGKSESEIRSDVASVIQEYVQAALPSESVIELETTDATDLAIQQYFSAIDPYIQRTMEILQDSGQYITGTGIIVPETFTRRILSLEEQLAVIPVPKAMASLHRSWIGSLSAYRSGLSNPIELREGNELQTYAQAQIVATLGSRVADVVQSYVQVYRSLR